jgi:hypothetical protein
MNAGSVISGHVLETKEAIVIEWLHAARARSTLLHTHTKPHTQHQPNTKPHTVTKPFKESLIFKAQDQLK